MEIDITEEVERDIAELESCMLFVDKNRYEIYKLATKKIYHKEHWIKIARSPINKTVQLAKSKKHPEEDYFIETVTQLPQPILQRIAGSESTRWGNIVWLFNLYSNKKVKPYTTLDAMKQQGKVVTEIQKIVDLDRKKYEEEEGQQVPEWHDEYYLEKNEQVISNIKNSNLKTDEK